MDQSIQIATEIEDPWLISHCQTKRVFPRIGPHFAEDNKELAKSIEPIVQKNLKEATRLNIVEDIGWNLIFYGDCAFLKRDGKAVEQRYGKALKFSHQINNKQMSCIAMIYIAYGLAMQNRYPKAQRLIEAALIGYESVGTTREMIQTKAVQIIKVKQQLWHPDAAGVSDDQLRQYTKEGAAMNWDEAVEYALDFEKD